MGVGMGKVLYIRESHNNAFRVERVFDIAGRVILHGVVTSGRIEPGMLGEVNGKEYMIESIEVRNQRIDYLLEGEEGDLIIKGMKAAKIEEDDFSPGQILTF